MSEPGRFDWLAEIPLFAPLTDSELHVLEAALVHHDLAEGATVVTQGERLGTDEGLYILRAGALTVSVRHPDGQVYEVAQLSPGAVIGLVGLIDPSITHSATVRATQPSQVAHLTRTAFKTLFNSHKPLAIAFQLVLARQLVADLRKTDEALRTALAQQGTVRLDASHTG